ncbi:MAG TPA: hypothetical protein VF138_01470 [Caulobacteraceae bacterium]
MQFSLRPVPAMLSLQPRPIALAALAGAFALVGFASQAADFRPISFTVAGAWNGVAPCLAPARLTARAIEQRLALAAGAKRIDAEVAGVRFKDQPAAEVAAFKAIASRRLRNDRQLAAAVARDCTDVLCASREVFGDEAGARILLLATERHYNAAPLLEGEHAWSVDDLDLLIAGFADWPTGSFPQPHGEPRIVREDSEDAQPSRQVMAHRLGVAAMAGEGQPGIVFFPKWRSIRPSERRAIVIHELAHEFARRQPETWRSQWAQAAAKDADRAGEGSSSFVSAYAESDIDEDFAESVSAYRYSAPLLMRRAPARYAYIKRTVFNGVEYGAAVSCRSANTDIQLTEMLIRQ